MQFKKINLPLDVKKPILALGADVKNTVCFAYKKEAYISEIIGDLKEINAFKVFQSTVASIPRLFKTHPSIVACDLHPEYFSVKYALNLSPRHQIVSVQHHHAHIASCMVENSILNKKVIGVAFDGTGLGEDNNFWGAEFFICDYTRFQRKGHLRTIPLLGGEKAILEPWRLICSWLYAVYGDEFLKLHIEVIKKIDKKNWAILKRMLLSGFNSPQSSSMGRLFDTVGALVLGKSEVSFEAEAAIALERSIVNSQWSMVRPYGFKVIKENNVYIIAPAMMFRQIISDLVNKKRKETVAAKFHLTVVEMIRRLSLLLRKETGINDIVLSGGVFQNKVLTNLSIGLLLKEGFAVHTHSKLPCSDVSLSLGQAAVASNEN